MRPHPCLEQLASPAFRRFFLDTRAEHLGLPPEAVSREGASPLHGEEAAKPALHEQLAGRCGAESVAGDEGLAALAQPAALRRRGSAAAAPPRAAARLALGRRGLAAGDGGSATPPRLQLFRWALRALQLRAAQLLPPAHRL